MNPPCEHKQVTHECGTNARYVLDRCRCEPCRDARRAADRKRQAYNAGVRPKPLVDAKPVRAHVLDLMDQGMGLKRIGQVAGVAHGGVSKLIYGDYKTGRRPSRRISRTNADKLLSVDLDLADGAHVEGTEARALVAELVARGWAKAEIGRRVHGPHAKSLQAADSEFVFAGTLRTLRRLQDEPVPERTHWTGSRYTPKTSHTWRTIPATTRGVPPHDGSTIRTFVGKGTLACDICGVLLTDHPFVACWRAA